MNYGELLWFEGKKNLDWEHDLIFSYMIVPPPTKSTVMIDLKVSQIIAKLVHVIPTNLNQNK